MKAALGAGMAGAIVATVVFSGRYPCGTEFG